jgi:hypothetical protein
MKEAIEDIGESTEVMGGATEKMRELTEGI